MKFSINENEQIRLTKLIATLDTNIEQFRKLILCIDLYTSKKYTNLSYIELKEFCKIIYNNIPFMISILEKTIVVRGRKNTKQLFSNQNELSYNKNIDVIEAGRFNLSKQSMFYGSLPTFRSDGSYINYGNQCPLFEICKELNNHNALTFPIFITLGFWKVDKQISVLNLCYDTDHLNENSNLKIAVTEFLNFIKMQCSTKVFDLISDIWKYFSELSRKWDENNCSNRYVVMTAFYEAFTESYRENYQKDIDGIIYPSAMTQAKGLNIVLHPQAVDTNLIFTHVQMYTLKSRALPFDYEPITKLITVKDESFVFDTKFVKEYELFTYSW